MTGILFLDLDGTVRYNRHGKTFINSADDVAVYPEAVEQMRRWDGPIVGITNQGGVALGYMTQRECLDAIEETERQCEDLFNLVLACYHKPNDGCDCRKPNPGNVYYAIGSLLASGDLPVPFQADRCLFVGDRGEDADCARSAGIPFRWAEDWRSE